MFDAKRDCFGIKSFFRFFWNEESYRTCFDRKSPTELVLVERVLWNLFRYKEICGDIISFCICQKRESGPCERGRSQERRKPGEVAKPGEIFTVLVLNLTLIVEVLGR